MGQAATRATAPVKTVFFGLIDQKITHHAGYSSSATTHQSRQRRQAVLLPGASHTQSPKGQDWQRPDRHASKFGRHGRRASPQAGSSGQARGSPLCGACTRRPDTTSTHGGSGLWPQTAAPHNHPMWQRQDVCRHQMPCGTRGTIPNIKYSRKIDHSCHMTGARTAGGAVFRDPRGASPPRP